MASMVMEAVQAEIGATERWPDDTQLFLPYEVQQITLPEAATCLSTKTFLNMCGLNYHQEQRVNAEQMSPSGKVPFIKVGPFLTSEFEPIVAFVNTRGFQLSGSLSEAERSEMKAYMAMIDNILVNAEMYLSWLLPTVATEITKQRYGAVHPWPLSWILPYLKQRNVKTRLSSIGWAEKTFENVCEEVTSCCQALSDRLGQQKFFFGDMPTELDAMVFGHLFTIITTNLPDMQLAIIVKRFHNLTDLCTRVEESYYRQNSADWSL